MNRADFQPGSGGHGWIGFNRARSRQSSHQQQGSLDAGIPSLVAGSVCLCLAQEFRSKLCDMRTAVQRGTRLLRYIFFKTKSCQPFIVVFTCSAA